MKKMNTAVLFSGGKDSTLALGYALKFSNVKCLISIISENPDSYMFHTPNISLVKMQAECIGIPIIIQKTKGVKEKELNDLKSAIKSAIKKYKIKGVVSGAVESVYQASRIQNICNDLLIECFNPLWQKDQIGLLNEVVETGFEVIIASIAADGFDNSWLGRKLDKKMISELVVLKEKYCINPAFEGGEAESFVLNAPFFKKRLIIKKAKKIMTGENSGYYNIEEMGFE